MQVRFDFTDSSIVVSGGTRGIGHAIATLFARAGARVAVIARNADQLAARRDEWAAEGLTVTCIQGDVSAAAQRNSAARQCLEQFERIHALVLSAGTNIRKPTVEYSTEDIARVWDTNMLGSFELARALHPALKRAGTASLLFIGSTAGLSTVPTGAPYAMSKAAIAQLTRYLAVEWAVDGIRCNCIAPWYIRTPLVEGVLSDPAWYERVLSRTPLGRVGEVEEVAGLAAFLCSEAASYISGQVVAVDGGFMAKGM